MRQVDTFPPAIRSYLRGFVVRRRRLLVLRAVGWAGFAAAVWLLLSCGVDRLLHLPSSIRLTLLAVGAATVLLILLWGLLPLRRRIDWVRVAQAIELANPQFAQRLVTVTSQLLDEPDLRGSEQIVSHLARQLDEEIGGSKRHFGIGARSALRPWALCAAATVALAALTRVPTLGMQQLLVRCVNPVAAVGPVTTTQLSVSPGDCDLPVGQPLQVSVQAERFRGDAVWIHVNDDGEHWSRSAMEPAGDGRFSFTVGNVERDVRYYITAGDATSSTYQVRVKRPPVVVEFRVRYTYPPYTGRAAFTLRNTDGVIEAPVGSEALVTIVASEPLQWAALVRDGAKIETSPAAQENARQVSLPVNKDAAYQVQLLSTRDVYGKAGQSIQVRAASDHPPIVRLNQANQTIRLSPRDSLPLNFQVLDDFGLSSVAIVAQINGDRTVRMPLTLGADSRHQEQTISLNLESWRLSAGDVVSLTIGARDNDGQTTASDPLRLLVSANAVDLESQARLRELADALQLAQMLKAQWDGAMRVASRSASPQTQADAPTSLRLTRYISSASELAALLHQSLLRVDVHSNSSELSDLLATWLDWSQQQANDAEELARQASLDEAAPPAHDRVQHAAELSGQLLDQLRLIARGERAAAVLADLKEIRQSPTYMPADPIAGQRRAQLLRQAQEDLSAGAKEAGVDPNAPDLQLLLRRRMEAAGALLHEARPIDWLTQARQWAKQVQLGADRASGFDARLTAAFHAEAVRPDSDPQRAQDLELACWAVAGYEAGAIDPSATKPADPTFPAAFVEVMSSLQRDWAVRGNSTRPTNQSIRAAADSARRQLAVWAGEPAQVATLRARSVRLRDARAEALAMRAGVETAGRNYQKAAELDDALARALIDAARPAMNPGPATRPDATLDPSAASRIEARVERIQRAHQAVARSVATVQTADKLQQGQEQLNEQARSANPSGAAELADQQRQLADHIDRAAREQDQALSSAAGSSDDDSQWRGRATEALATAQQGLSTIPQALAAVQSAAAAKRDADDRAKAADAEASAAQGTEQKEMAQRAADQARADASDAADRLQRALTSVQPLVAEQLAKVLAPFAPDTSGARDVVTQDLSPALAALASVATGGDVAGVEQHAAEARQAIDAAQAQLARAQDALMQRDPLFSAKWFARAAADALARSSPDIKSVLAQQANSTVALSHAWDRAAHRAAAQRLAMLPSLQAVYAPSAARDPPRPRLPQMSHRSGNGIRCARSAMKSFPPRWPRLIRRGMKKICGSISRP
jgi:hypothetical protein